MALWNLMGTGSGLMAGERPIPLTMSQLLAKADQVEAAEWASGQVTGTFKEDHKKFVTQVPPESTQISSKLFDALLEKGVLDYKGPGAGATILGLLGILAVPIMVLLMIWFFVFRPMQMGGNQAMSFGRSRAKRVGESTPKITFDDVAGIDEAKEELYEIVDFLKNTKKYTALGAKIPKGILLTGPPGVGKTHLARAIAGEAGVPFFHISGSDFVEMFVGVGAARVRDLFETAKAHRPSLIFIDEIDAVGRQRGAGLGGGHDEREQTLNQLLVEMDGFDPNSGVIMIAATNRPDVLDPALLRPGRFDRHIVVDVPDANGREAILKIHAKGKPLESNIDLNAIGRRTPGFTGADLANMLNEGALLAARRNHSKVRQDDLEDALDRTIAGPERKSRIMSASERKIIAYHEAGHAVVGELLEHTDPVHKVTVLPRGMSLGSTWQLPIEDKHLISKQELIDDITALLAGRVAEEIVFGEVTTGASNDLERVTRIARAMICEYGMSEKLGTLSIGKRGHNPFLGRDYTMDERNYSEDVARMIDEEVRELVDRCHRRAHDILTQNRSKLDAIVDALFERETLDREEFLAVLQGRELPLKKVPSSPQPELELDPGHEAPKSGKAKPKPQLEPGTAQA
ncbi:MAG: ATP-dependent zinc metalloprotease FtsH [Armatimonadetes bacterium]|nr:ATP-dependent zinc metalloprotease FtsH [Armatimonadota bacterium]